MMVENNFQSLCLSMGNNACYFMCVINIAEEYTHKKYDVFTILAIANAHKVIDFDYDNLSSSNNFYMEDAAKLLYILTGKKWTVRKEPSYYKPKKQDYIVQHWTKGYGDGHFNRPNFDSCQNSQTVKIGKIDSYRIFNVED